MEKRNQWKKHITSLKNEDGSILRNAKQILAEEENMFKNKYKSKNISLETNDSVHFFDSPDLKTLNNEEAERCEGLLRTFAPKSSRAKSLLCVEHARQVY